MSVFCGTVHVPGVFHKRAKLSFTGIALRRPQRSAAAKAYYWLPLGAVLLATP